MFTRYRLALVTAATALALAGCTNGPTSTNQAGPALGVGSTVKPATLRVALGGRPVALDQRVSVSVARGTLTEVSLTDKAGSTVEGSITGRTWIATSGLAPDTTYRLSAAAQNSAGDGTTRDWSFRTGPAPATDSPAVTPLAGTTVGVGHPVIVYFDQDVADKAEVESHLNITTSTPVEGSWGWIDNRSVAWRPKEFWPGHTEVSLDVDLAAVEVADGIWGEDRTIDFTVGRSFVMKVTDATHQMVVEEDGKAIREIPVSMGKPGFTTRSGVKVIMTQEVSRRMDSATVSIGGAEAYDLDVPYAMRLTATGEFVHGAPWSEWAQGDQNVSHGCTNVSLDNAIWLYHNTLIGDPVVTTGTGRPTETWNGLGGIWNFTWSQWQARSALG